jgi:hypothetical protein
LVTWEELSDLAVFGFCAAGLAALWPASELAAYPVPPSEANSASMETMSEGDGRRAEKRISDGPF